MLTSRTLRNMRWIFDEASFEFLIAFELRRKQKHRGPLYTDFGCGWPGSKRPPRARYLLLEVISPSEHDGSISIARGHIKVHLRRTQLRTWGASVNTNDARIIGI